MVESFCQTVPIKLKHIVVEGKEDEKIWNEVELVQEQRILLQQNFREPNQGLGSVSEH
jgi:hypothetical protein